MHHVHISFAALFLLGVILLGAIWLIVWAMISRRRSKDNLAIRMRELEINEKRPPSPAPTYVNSGGTVSGRWSNRQQYSAAASTASPQATGSQPTGTQSVNISMPAGSPPGGGYGYYPGYGQGSWGSNGFIEGMIMGDMMSGGMGHHGYGGGNTTIIEESPSHQTDVVQSDSGFFSSGSDSSSGIDFTSSSDSGSSFSDSSSIDIGGGSSGIDFDF